MREVPGRDLGCSLKLANLSPNVNTCRTRPRPWRSHAHPCAGVRRSWRTSRAQTTSATKTSTTTAVHNFPLPNCQLCRPPPLHYSPAAYPFTQTRYRQSPSAQHRSLPVVTMPGLPRYFLRCAQASSHPSPLNYVTACAINP